MIITCPHCQTKYQVTYEAIGSAGRKVQCAHCQQAWQQQPLDTFEPTEQQKRAFDEIIEDGLDEDMASEERAVALEQAKRIELENKAEEVQRRAADAATAAASAAAGRIDPAVVRSRQRAFTRRQNAMAADLPLARMRRTLRVLGAVLLIGVVSTGYFGRAQVVQQFPAMAGVYQAVGLGVNVVGLDFSNVTSQRTTRDGKEVLAVSAQLVGLRSTPQRVPPVVVTLLDANGHGIYEWSVTPSVRDLMAGERATFDTQITLPPAAATRVRLRFAGGQNMPLLAQGTAAQATSAAAPSLPATSGAASDHTIPEHH